MKNTKPALGFIFTTLIIDITGFGIIIPVFPKLIQELTGGTLSEASEYGGWLLFSFAFMQFLFSPVLGNLSDQYGRRPVLLISLFGFAVDYLLLAFAPTILWLFAGRLIAGMMGASITTATAYIADISSPEKRAQNFGMVGAAFGLGFIIGPVIGGILGEYGSRVPFFVAAGLTFINFLYGYFILPESLSKVNRRKFELKRANPLGSLKMLRRYPLIAGMSISLLLIYIASHAVQSTWSFFTMDQFKWTESQVGYSLGFVGVLVALVQGLLIRVINPRLGNKNSVITGMILYTAGLSAFAFAPNFGSWMMFAALIPYCLGGISGPAIQSILSAQVPANEQGELQGALTGLISITAIIGPVMMTGLFSFFGDRSSEIYFPGAAFFAAAVLAIISMLAAIKALRKYSLLNK
jgi:DHA1 family tetracycline resistance protein-like MFS transporter